MKLFAESLMSELEHQLKLIHLETENPVHSAELAIKNSVATLERLKTFFIKYKRVNKKEEIESEYPIIYKMLLDMKCQKKKTQRIWLDMQIKTAH